MYKMTVDFPNLAKGAEVQIDGLGIFENGYEHTISDELAQSYRAAHPKTVDEVDDDGELVERKLEQGPTLLTAFKDSLGIVVEVVQKTKNKQADENPAQGTKGDDK